MVGQNKIKNYQLAYAVLLICVLLLPQGLKLSHAFEAHVAIKHCDEISDHIHEKTPHIDLLDYALLSGIELVEFYTPIFTASSISSSQDFYSFKPYKKSYFGVVSRGPPSI
ncbi:MAG: hypothetical protein ISP72_01535 [Flavobacteriaceae bacterium]|nr:hypothetical protein [Flavobacteriaceae bacterium]